MKDSQLMPKRVELPNLTEAEKGEVESYKEYVAWRTRTQVAFLTALMKRCVPFTGKPKPQRKPTKHQRRIANARTRSKYLLDVSNG